MYKLLIADDEQIVIDSLKYIVNKRFPGEFTMESARSGRESIEKAEAFIPDIIFMDINMPGINGIDALNELRSKLPQCIFIILTAFDQFDFAKDAIRLGVTEYLLKPVNREKIIDTLEKSKSEIDVLRSKRKNELDLKEKLENVLPVLESGFIYSLFFLDDNSLEMNNYRNIFEIKEDGGYIMTIEFAQSKDSGHMVNRIGLSVKGLSFYPLLRDIIKAKCKCFIGPVILNRIIVYVPCDTCKDEYGIRLDAISMAEYIQARSASLVNADFFIGLGRIYKGFENIYRSYEESLMAIRYTSEAGVVHIMDIPSGIKLSSEQYPVSAEKLMLEKAAAGDTEACIQAFSHIFEWLQIEYYGSETKIKSKLLELMVLASRLAYDHGIDAFCLDSTGFISEFQKLNNISAQKLWCVQRLEFITKCICEVKDKNISGTIHKATNYIKENFRRDITLEDVSKEVNISPHYFCKLFKEEMGENFIDYLTNIRINKAKEIMKDSLLSIKEICYEIGYGDPNYFSRLFKKNAGMTPTEYRDRLSYFNKGGVSLNEN